MRPPFFPNKFARHEFEIDDEGKIFINGREIDIEQTNIKLIAFLNHTKKILTRSKIAQTQKTKEERMTVKELNGKNRRVIKREGLVEERNRREGKNAI